MGKRRGVEASNLATYVALRRGTHMSIQLSTFFFVIATTSRRRETTGYLALVPVEIRTG